MVFQLWYEESILKVVGIEGTYKRLISSVWHPVVGHLIDTKYYSATDLRVCYSVIMCLCLYIASICAEPCPNST